MGRRGPLPKRMTDSDGRVLREKPGTTVAVVSGRVFGMEPDEGWHPIARMIWDAAMRSPQKRFYEETDWAVLYYLCDEVSEHKKLGRRSAQMVASLNPLMLALLLTEGDRRRLQIEITRPDEAPEESAGVTVMKAWEERRRKVSGGE